MADSVPVMITGTPGVGKTMMWNWYLKHLLSRPFAPDEQVRTVFMHSSDNPRYYMVRMELVPPDPGAIPNPDAEGAPVQVRVTTTSGKDVLYDRKLAAPTGLAYSLVDVETNGTCACVDAPCRPGDRLVLFTSPSNSPKDKFQKKSLRTY
jgi:hypothetical protein